MFEFDLQIYNFERFKVAAQNYSTIGAAQGICGDDYVCQDYYYGYFYCCDPWFEKHHYFFQRHSTFYMIRN